VAKIVWGYLSGSLGMLSDGFHSLFDGVTNILGLVGIWMSDHPPDREHPYGHKKFETVFTLIVAGLIFMTCFEVLKGVWRSMHTGSQVEVTATSFVIMALTMAVNLAVMRYEMGKGRKLNSPFLKADALHTKSNILSSAGVVVGLAFAGMGFRFADVLAGLVVAVFIARIGYEILREATDVLVDTVNIDIEAVRREVLQVEGVRDCHKIRARGPADHVQLDLHIKLDSGISLRDAHHITHHVQDHIYRRFPQVRDIVVHTEPT
jgi:cation diffusion facilitator family transporter